MADAHSNSSDGHQASSRGRVSGLAPFGLTRVPAARQMAVQHAEIDHQIVIDIEVIFRKWN